MSNESRQNRWLRLLTEESDAYERMRLLNEETAGPARRENFAREWFAAWSRLLKEHFRSHALPKEGGPLEPYPGDAIGRAVDLMEAFSTGHFMQCVVDLRASGGAPEKSRFERLDLATAIQYIELAKSGEIRDLAFNATVAKAFQVDRTTVQKWYKNRDKICAGIPDIPVEDFPRALHIAGARYHYNRTGERTEGVD